MPDVDGEDTQKAKETKHLTGPSEEELSKGREATVAYVPPPMLVPVEAPKAKAAKAKD